MVSLVDTGDGVVGGKHGKYIYIKTRNNEYIKARVFKNRADDDPERYLVTGPRRSNAPLTYPVIDIDDLPAELRDKILGEKPPEKGEEELGEQEEESSGS